MSVTIEGQIDIAGPVGKLLHRRPLKNSTVMQSFGIDPVTGEVFVAQVVQGGLTLAGESGPVSGTVRATNGDLCVTRLDQAGTVTGFMYLRGFGHGVSMAVENRAGASYLWTETASQPNKDNDGYGTAITHFAFRTGTVLDYGSAQHAAPYTPVTGATNVTCTIDPTLNRLVVRFSSGGMKYESYDLAKAAAGVWEPLARIAQPSPNGVFQGYASLGGVLYMLAGEAIAADNPDNPPPGNTYLTAVEWATGAVLDQQRVTAAPGLEYREPEGMAVSVRAGVPHLHFGFACEDPGPRTATILSLSAAPEIDGVKVLTDWQPIALAAGVTADQSAPKGRLISIAGTTTLQLSGGVKGTFDSDAVIGTLPDALTPSLPVRANVPRNNSAGYCAARVEADTSRELRLYGGRSTNAITWAQLDSFSAVWR
ncbi:Tat pathway signal sequence domain protein [Streptomyces sp. 12297]|uniref:phage baseplate protein n=1 Tax=Streptomyces sp. NBC_00239 TaxID=2903640 RepID=UPI002E2C1C74|nr:Tat pathway signal sequence domain protein [Streptomyces sp. NBC_00239]